MSNIIINSSELTSLLATMDNCPDQNIMLVGKHGIGKSEILTEYYSSKGLRVIPFFLGQMSDPGDLIGLPKLSEDGRTEFMPPVWFPKDNEPIVLFLDELNRARPEILQVIMDLCLNKKLAGRSLPAGSRIISAVNGGLEYNITDLDPALVSRFNIYEFIPTVDEWVSWATKKGVDDRVIGFIQYAPQYLDGNGISSTALDKTPDRRAWKKVSDLIMNQDDINDFIIKILSGIIGISAAASFNSWLKENHLPSPEDVLLRFTKTQKSLLKLQLNEMSNISQNICQYIDTHTDNKKLAKGLLAYTKFLAELPEKGKANVNKSSDAIHDLCNLYMSDKYKNLSEYILENCYEAFDILRALV